MNQWLDVFLSLLNTLLCNPRPGLEQWLIPILAGLVAMVVLDKTGSTFEAQKGGGIRALLLTLAGGALVVLAMTAVTILWPVGGTWARVGAAVLVSVVVVAPMISGMQKSGYVGALMAWAISVGAAACVILLISYGVDAFASGSKQAGTATSHKRDVQQVLGP